MADDEERGLVPDIRTRSRQFEATYLRGKDPVCESQRAGHFRVGHSYIYRHNFAADFIFWDSDRLARLGSGHRGGNI
jgi:hypothetical protein